MSLLMAQFINKRANNESIPNESRVNHGPQFFFFSSRRRHCHIFQND
jgi:hypothetical protein